LATGRHLDAKANRARGGIAAGALKRAVTIKVARISMVTIERWAPNELR